jgi:MoaA/NifB/PqqE/SkfB family radical SAM enzyme
MFISSIEDIWNGEYAAQIRKSCWEGQYGYCNFNHCYPKFIDKNKFEAYYDEKSGVYGKNPKLIEFGHDIQCNVACITCRSKKIFLSKQQVEKYDSLIEPLFIPILKDAQEVFINSSGEVFASPHSKKLVSAIISKYPNIKFMLISNGILFNEKNAIELLGDLNKLIYAQISIHAATEETYNKIVVGGNFDKAMQNIKWLAKLKREQKLNVLLVFVVQAINYMEMKQFVELAVSLDVTARFSNYRNWSGGLVSQQYKDYAVFLKEHPQYNDLKKILKDPIFEDRHCILNTLLANIRNEN